MDSVFEGVNWTAIAAGETSRKPFSKSKAAPGPTKKAVKEAVARLAELAVGVGAWGHVLAPACMPGLTGPCLPCRW